MLSTIAFVVAGLSTGHKIGLAAVGAAFIIFALVSSFLIPRRAPNFPGKNIGWYVAACVLFFVAMLSAVLVFGRESKESTGNEPSGQTVTQSAPLPGQATTTTSGSGSGGGGSSSSSTSTMSTTTGTAKSNGDATAGKKVFLSAGCTGCHTLKDAGSTGNVGPNLDQLKPSFAAVQHQVEHGGGAMPAFKGQLSQTQIDNVAAYVSSVAGS
jgi:mono/diheme cytochrome c family protein